MQGIIVVDKPEGFTSFDVDAKLRRVCGTRRIGHGGTLDPMATGVLPVFVGTATKAVDMCMRDDKRYTAVMLLGRRTDTGDVTGTVLEEADVHDTVNERAVAAVLPHFTGTQQQIPPMYSAVKVNGQPLYKAARAGKTVERAPRTVTVHSLTLLDRPSPNEYRLAVHCSKGVYVRVLLEEIGRALGVPATMSALRRTASGVYTLDMAHTLPELLRAGEDGTLSQLFLSVETVFEDLPAINVNADIRQKLLNGAPVYRFSASDGRYRLRCADEFLGVGAVENHVLRAQKLFLSRDSAP